MPNRTLTTALTAALSIWSFIGFAGPFILRMLGHYDEAQELDQAMKIFDSLNISWFAVYLLVFIASDCFLFALQWQLVTDTFSYLANRNRREWDITIPQLVEYIRRSSRFSASLPMEGAYETVAAAIQEAAREGKLRLAGRKDGATKIAPISRKESKLLTFSVVGIRAPHGPIITPTGLIIANENDPKSEYAMVYADRNEVASIWPQSRS